MAPAAAQEVASAAPCLLRGTAPVPKGTQMYDARSDGRLLATFSGAVVPLTLNDIPADPASGRALLRTSNGGGALRLEGWVPAASLHVYTTRDVPVVAGHVWLAAAQRERLVRSAGAALDAELTITGSQSQAARGSAPCDAFSLQRGAAIAMEVPGNGRGYRMKSATLPLFADAKAADAPIFTLRMTDTTGQLFWSTEARAGFVRVKTRGDVVIDAWARSADLDPLAQGEMRDQLLPPQTSVASAQLTLDKAPRLVKTTKEIVLRARRDTKERPIGVVEAGAEVYVTETVAGWSNLLPRHLGMTPPPEGGFWAPSGEVPR
ncbi:MAG: hypothetical protein WKG00_37135 [Polyangiaceae bacterium]